MEEEGKNENSEIREVENPKEKEKVTYPKVASEAKSKGGTKKVLKILLILAVVAGLIAGGWYLLREPDFNGSTQE